MQHIHAGKKDHWREGEVDRFCPVATEIRFNAPVGKKAPFMTLRWPGQSLIDEKAFWSACSAPTGVLWDEAAEFAKVLVREHRVLTGQIKQTYELIEVRPTEIAKIRSMSDTLTIHCKQLVDFIAADDRIWELSFGQLWQSKDEATDDEDAFERALHEKLCLTDTFIKAPCDIELFGSLYQEYRSGNYSAVGFDNFYTWFRQSELLLTPEGQFTDEAKDAIGTAINSWVTSTAADQSQERLDQHVYWAARNFKVHPHHRHLVVELVQQIAGATNSCDTSPNSSPSYRGG